MGAWFMSIVPLNFGAAAPFRLKPHFMHVDAVSEFCVPQFGQNTHHLRSGSLGVMPTVSQDALRSLVEGQADSQANLTRYGSPVADCPRAP
jgi:hypothetical protein